jgi:hypothetical protein
MYTKKLLTVRLEVDEDFNNVTADLKCLEFDDTVILLDNYTTSFVDYGTIVEKHVKTQTNPTG